MVDGRLLGDLILKEGLTVSAYGWFDDSDDREPTLWVADAWQPQRFHKCAGADVRVRPVDDVAVPASTPVEVIGTWHDGSIVDAVVMKTDNPITYRHESSKGTVHPVDFGRDNTVGLISRLSNSGSAPTIASGGTDSGIWLHVLYATEELVRIHGEAPLKTDLFVSIVPIGARAS